MLLINDMILLPYQMTQLRDVSATFQVILRNNSWNYKKVILHYKWTKLLTAIKTACSSHTSVLRIVSHCVRICCFANTYKIEPQLMSCLRSWTVTSKNTALNRKTVWAFALMMHRPWQGQETGCRH